MKCPQCGNEHVRRINAKALSYGKQGSGNFGTKSRAIYQSSAEEYKCKRCGWCSLE